MPPRVYKPHYLLVKDPINLPYDLIGKLEDPRLNYYSPRSRSIKDNLSELSELDAMLRIQLETEGIIPEETTTPTEYPIHDTTPEAPEEKVPASDWIILDTIGTTDDF